MKHTIKNVIEVNLEKDQDINIELEKIQKQYKIKSGFYSGIGAGEKIEVGFLYSTNPIKYKIFKCETDHEITAFIGNIKDGVYHTHITLGNENANTISGHFLSGKVSFKFQLYINILEYYN